MYEYKNILRNYYVFLKYYYNESDGRLFRLRFVNDTLKQKKEENKITSETYKAFQKILESFIRYKICFESVGIAGFGDEKISYIDLVNIIYKLCKILEFYYLRNMKYESLQDLRTDYLLYIEKEIYTFIE